MGIEHMLQWESQLNEILMMGKATLGIFVIFSAAIAHVLCGPVPEGQRGRTIDVYRNGPCYDRGVRHEVGTAWTCSDGCNTCFCAGSGIVGSTLMGCNFHNN